MGGKGAGGWEGHPELVALVEDGAAGVVHARGLQRRLVLVYQRAPVVFLD